MVSIIPYGIKVFFCVSAIILCSYLGKSSVNGQSVRVIGPVRTGCVDEVECQFLYGNPFREEKGARAIYLACKSLNERFTNQVSDQEYCAIYLRRKLIEFYWPYLPRHQANKYVTSREPELYNKFFFQKEFKYSYIFLDINQPVDKGLILELGACINTCRVAKQRGLDYSDYKDRAQNCMLYLKDVYKFVSTERKHLKVEIGRLIHILEKEMSRL